MARYGHHWGVPYTAIKPIYIKTDTRTLPNI
ncbi:hypothetical protein [Bartonella bacilliformis]